MPWVLPPFTPIELIKTKRLAPASAAWRANFKVPSTLTLRNADKGSVAPSSNTWARAAVWITTSTPAKAWLKSAVSKLPSASNPSELFSVGKVRQKPLTVYLELARKVWNKAEPTKPVAPVMAIDSIVIDLYVIY